MNTRFQVRHAEAQITDAVQTLVEIGLSQSEDVLPTLYRSASKGTVAIRDMHTLHILRAARKTTDPASFKAFCLEIGERFIRGDA